ncbi:metallophosphoesterase [Haloprofundus marisrubri]|uniref:Metallophosphoesterase n=1 Tax=Haloprofundus marisrubri TaxID=1514971 RepID=A0A0W1R8K9_9EURY|nr:metallophosphoesterase [Haloprofundus marisrubri]KTG09772.1 metallophosphoesterase [Haloprofundus marisrubri]
MPAPSVASCVPGFVVASRSVFLPESETLVVSDLHIGRDEASDVEFPLGERADLRERLTALLDRFSPAEVVFAGDVLHSFGRASVATRETLGELTDVCRKRGVRPVLVVGNHDTMLSSVWDGPLYDEYRPGGGNGEGGGGGGDDGNGGPTADVLVCHGHEEPDGDADCYVVGHDHPTIDIEGRRRPCFLYGPETYRVSDVLMLPAFSRLAPGVEINRMYTRDFQSPLVTDADALRPLVYDEDSEETLRFPPLGKFRRML